MAEVFPVWHTTWTHAGAGILSWGRKDGGGRVASETCMTGQVMTTLGVTHMAGRVMTPGVATCRYDSGGQLPPGAP